MANIRRRKIQREHYNRLAGGVRRKKSIPFYIMHSYLNFENCAHIKVENRARSLGCCIFDGNNIQDDLRE